MTKEGKDREFMRLAIRLALRGEGQTSPNPMVGSIVVSRGGKELGRGFHERAGEPHAEINALERAGKKAKGATLYVTLEPCVHHGRTPPCVDSIIEAGVRRVVVGTKDPNAIVAGRGIRKLRRAGVEVTTGVLAAQCSRLNEGYNKFITTGLPFVILKLATTLDGRIATSSGESKWITGAEARRQVHKMRARVDAVMVGSGTVLKDNPSLNVRGIKGVRDPVRVVLDSRFKTPLGAKIFSVRGGAAIVYTTRRAKAGKIEAARALGATVVILPETKDGVSIKRVLRDMAKRGITSVMIEGGASLATGALKASLVDKLALFVAPKLLGGDALAMVKGLNIKSLKRAIVLSGMKERRLGADILIEGYLG